MTTKTRYFLVGSVLTLTVGLGVGLVAYSMGFSTAAFTAQGGPEELRFVPANAALVAYAEGHSPHSGAGGVVVELGPMAEVTLAAEVPRATPMR